MIRRRDERMDDQLWQSEQHLKKVRLGSEARLNALVRRVKSRADLGMHLRKIALLVLAPFTQVSPNVIGNNLGIDEDAVGKFVDDFYAAASVAIAARACGEECHRVSDRRCVSAYLPVEV